MAVVGLAKISARMPNICRNLQLRRGLVLRYSFGSGRGATVEFTAGLAVNLCWSTHRNYDRWILIGYVWIVFIAAAGNVAD